MPKTTDEIQFLTEEELRGSRGVGASDVAAVLHESPWTTAFALWQIKTGRQKKPDAGLAAAFGREMEATAMAAYFLATGYAAESFTQQVRAQHSHLQFLRCIADGWNGKDRRLVDVKVPTSHKLIDAMERGEIPRHYLLQVAAEMDIFHTEEFDFAVYDARKKAEDEKSKIQMVTVTWDWPWGDGLVLAEFWYDYAIPALKAFWDCVTRDVWYSDDADEQVFTPNEDAWIRAMSKRVLACQQLDAAQESKDEAEAEIQRLLARHKAASAAGWKAAYHTYKPLYAIHVSVENEQSLSKVLSALESLRQVEGVKGVKSDIRPAREVLSISMLEEEAK